MLKGILFDLDGTLLDIEMDSFLRRYFGALAPVVGALAPSLGSAEDSIGAVLKATEAMCQVHAGSTNADVFNSTFATITGIDLATEPASGAIADFYRNTFPTLNGDMTARPGARRAVEQARSAGLSTVVATNPIFPREAVRHRLSWAGFSIDEFDSATSYEHMTACKPQGDYFVQTAALIGLHPEECLMVGDDLAMDGSAARVGMRVFYVGSEPADDVDWSGSLDDLADLLASGAIE